MKREEILFYLTDGKIIFYQVHNRREYVYLVDTSLFLKWGEISDVERLTSTVARLSAKLNLGLFYLKPNVTVLYNDVCHCDIKFLYKSALMPIGYNRISFIPISKIVKMIKDSDNLVLSSADCFTLINRKIKVASIEELDFEPVVIGKCDNKHVHFSSEDIIFKTFKSCFTKNGKYGIMEAGDDDV